MRTKLSAIFFLTSLILSGQTLNPTPSINNPGSVDNFKGGYTFSYNAAGTPWNGALLSFGGFNNTYDTQISSNYFDSNLSFRSRNGDNNTWNRWVEVATKESNYFNGNQTMIGNVGIGANPVNKLDIVGGHMDSFIQLHAANGSSPHAYLTLWASEPATSYTGVGIGNNIRNYDGAAPFTRVNIHKGGSYIRLLENEINFNLISDGGIKQQSMTLYGNGNASLQGKFEAKEVRVTQTPTADFVFEDNYSLPKLEDVEKHIKEKKYLPEIASATQMEKEGVNVGEFQIKLLQKIEELTLYSIEQNKQIKQLLEINKILKDEVDLIKLQQQQQQQSNSIKN